MCVFVLLSVVCEAIQGFGRGFLGLGTFKSKVMLGQPGSWNFRGSAAALAAFASCPRDGNGEKAAGSYERKVWPSSQPLMAPDPTGPLGVVVCIYTSFQLYIGKLSSQTSEAESIRATSTVDGL